MRRGRKPTRKMARGGRTRPTPRGRGRKMPGGGRTCGGMNQPPCPGGGYRRGGRTRPAPRGRGRRFQAGGHAHDAHTHPYNKPQFAGQSGSPTVYDHKHNLWESSIGQTSASLNMGQGPHQHGAAPPDEVQTFRSRIPTTRRTGGRVTHQLRRGGRTRPTSRARGRQMARGGRAPARRFQGGGQSICPAGTERLADGRCTKMGS